MLTPRDAAAIFEEMALLLELRGENPFKVRAWANAARMLETTDKDLANFVEGAKAGAIKGFGKDLSAALEIFCGKGKLPLLDELRKEFPATLFDLFKIPGLGPKKVKALYEKLAISSLEQLSEACNTGAVATLEGFGEKTQEKILAGIERIKQFSNLFRCDQAHPEAEVLLCYLNKSPDCRKVAVGGSIRRRKEIVKDIDLLCTSAKPEKLMNYFCKYPEAAEVTAHGDTKSSLLLKSGIAVDLRVVEDSQYAAALLHFTGSKEHNTILRTIAKQHEFKLNEYGLFSGEKPLKLDSEEAIYNKLGLCFIPPELREGLHECDEAKKAFAKKKELPTLVTDTDIKGILHIHSAYSDGTNSIEQIARHAIKLGYQYIGITDHSQSAAYAGGLLPEKVKAQHKEIDALNDRLAPFRIFKGIESDILVDGALDYSEKVLATFDFVIASVHSRFSLTRAEMTKRVISAIKNPYTTIFGHATGRLLLQRDSYEIDLNAVIDAAAEQGVAIEINADPHRLELDWRYLPRAKELGIAIPICPDAHSLEGFDNIRYGVGIARKGWLTKDDVMNCWDLKKISSYFSKRSLVHR